MKIDKFTIALVVVDIIIFIGACCVISYYS